MSFNESQVRQSLLAARLVSPADIEAAATTASATGRGLIDTLLSTGAVSEEEFYRHLAEQHDLPFGNARDLLTLAQPTTALGIADRYLDSCHLVILARHGRTAIVAGTSTDRDCWASLATAMNVDHIDYRLVTPTDYSVLRNVLHLEADATLARPAPPLAVTPAVTESTTDSAILTLIDTMLTGAIAARASDIHIETYGRIGRLRFRVDGDLRDVPRGSVDPATYSAALNVVKVRAQLDITEHRLPQGGRFSLHVPAGRFDVRVQTQPALHGEHAVLRLLPQGARPRTLEELGLRPGIALAYRRLLDSPQGLVLVVGPTGSGKSTTLYAGIQRLASDPTRKVLTIEDPIEYAVDGIQQSQTHPEIGWGFAHAMRAFVREDPDVILVGEIRDAETALEAARASQTGHLVLATMHCNDAVDTVQRLRDLGLRPNSIASELVAVFAQRLAKRICDQCRAPDPSPDSGLLQELFPAGAPPDFECWRGVGCAQCEGAGTRGRVAVIEHLRVGPAFRRAVYRGLSLDDLRDAAATTGHRLMRTEALECVTAGIIPLEELRYLLPAHEIAAPT